MNVLRHIIFILILGFAYADICEDPTACNYTQESECVYENEWCGQFGPDEICSCSIPMDFQFNSSSLQGFYYINLVTINGFEVDPNDWVASYKDDICVGARHWDTNGFCSDGTSMNEDACECGEGGDWEPNDGICTV